MYYIGGQQNLNPLERKEQSLGWRVFWISIGVGVGALVIGIKLIGLGNLWVEGSDLLIALAHKVYVVWEVIHEQL